MVTLQTLSLLHSLSLLIRGLSFSLRKSLPFTSRQIHKRWNLGTYNTMKINICRQCETEAASVHCASDSAFLCFDCDVQVHSANFIAARHVRRPICSRCGSLTDIRFSGPDTVCGPAICRTCCGIAVDFNRGDSSTSSACISGTGSAVCAPRKRRGWKMDRISSSNSVTEDTLERFSGEVDSRRNHTSGRSGVDRKAEQVFLVWFRRLGLSEGEAIDRVYRALGFCNGRFTLIPLRMLLAAAVRLSLRTCGDPTLRRLEEISGVPRKLISATEATLVRLNKVERCSDLEEGWDECSP